MSDGWFKLYHNVPDDIKLRRFTAEEKWAWVALLCLASQSKTRGVIQADDDDIARYCEFPSTQAWLCYKDKLVSKNMAEINSDGHLRIVHWDERQHLSEGDRDWSYRRHRRFVFARDNYMCVYCGSQQDLTLDHVTPQSKGGSHDRENLVACCSTCNSSKGAKTVEEWLRGNS